MERQKPATLRINHDLGKTKLIHIGNSQGVMISKVAIAILGWKEGDGLDVDLEVKENRIIITNVTKVFREMEQRDKRGESLVVR